MLYESYKRNEEQVEAALFTDKDEIGSVVENLLQVGISTITISVVNKNPQLPPPTTEFVHVGYIQDGQAFSLFQGDYLVFSDDDKVRPWSAGEFEATFTLEE